jgi:hypothetical protein
MSSGVLGGQFPDSPGGRKGELAVAMQTLVNLMHMDLFAVPED